MKMSIIKQTLFSLLIPGALIFIARHPAYSQFMQNRETVRVNTSGYPPDIKKDYRVFETKCGECHTLDKSLKPSLPAVQWATEVKRMQAMASSHISDKDVQRILDFLNYDESNRKAQLKSRATPNSTNPHYAGPQLFSSLGCDTCHTISGSGNGSQMSLSGVGSRLSRDEIANVVKNGKAGTAMPAVDQGTTEQQLNELIDYLASLR